MTAPTKILELVERFNRNVDAYKQGKYNEAQVRKEFIDPFFKELGWDVDNEKGYAEAYKDVVHEDAIRVGRATKAPDYSFRIGGSRKFFLEAKKPSVYIKEDIIRTIDFTDVTDKARHDQMVALVERMLELHKQLAEANTPQAKTVLQRQIDATDHQIDRLVYELYDLTEKEIKIVEESR